MKYSNTIRRIVLSTDYIQTNYLTLELIMEVIASASEEALVNPLSFETPKPQHMLQVDDQLPTIRIHRRL